MTNGRDVLDFLNDIVDAMDAALEFVTGMDAEQFRSDRKTTFDVQRAQRFLVWHVRYPSVPWRQMAGMRDRLIHGYATVDFDIVWQTVRQDIAAARPAVLEALQRERANTTA